MRDIYSIVSYKDMIGLTQLCDILECFSGIYCWEAISKYCLCSTGDTGFSSWIKGCCFSHVYLACKVASVLLLAVVYALLLTL